MRPAADRVALSDVRRDAVLLLAHPSRCTQLLSRLTGRPTTTRVYSYTSAGVLPAATRALLGGGGVHNRDVLLAALRLAVLLREQPDVDRAFHCSLSFSAAIARLLLPSDAALRYAAAHRWPAGRRGVRRERRLAHTVALRATSKNHTTAILQYRFTLSLAQ